MFASLLVASLVLVEIRDELGKFGPVVHDAEEQAVGIPRKELQWLSLLFLLTRHSAVIVALRQSGLLVGVVLLHGLEESLQLAFFPLLALPFILSLSSESRSQQSCRDYTRIRLTCRARPSQKVPQKGQS